MSNSVKKSVLFIDRDGVLFKEPTDYQVDNLSKVAFPKYMLTALSNIAKCTDYELVMVTNQDGLGTDSFPEKDFWPAQELLLDTLESVDVRFQQIFIDRSRPSDNSPYRKPGTAMLTSYIKGDYDLENSFVIGDRWSDVELAKNLACKAIRVNALESSETPAFLKDVLVLNAKNWKEIESFLLAKQRLAKAVRNTNETKISVALNLDGEGKSDINTGLAFFDHMLDQIAKHSGIDLNIDVHGDLEVDEHHTIEDTAIALGEVLKAALSKKVGMERYGFSLPMDDCRAQVLLDFGGRSWLEWEAEFKREKVGDMPTEMFFHFFKSLSENASCNLSIVAHGDNEHHKIESIFKAFARALKMAIKRDVNNLSIPTTKGLL